MGKIDIDYEILHSAFFKHQKKQEMTKHGEIYFEGKENEVTDTNFKPGRISKELSAALGIPEGASTLDYEYVKVWTSTCISKS